jgi:hypothetical protein
VQAVWEAIALHTTPGIPKHMRSEVALLEFRCSARCAGGRI